MLNCTIDPSTLKSLTLKFRPKTTANEPIKQAYSQERQKAYNLLTMEFVVASEYDDLNPKPGTGRGGSRADAAWLEGDMDMYSLENQKKRRRLKHAAAVQVSGSHLQG